MNEKPSTASLALKWGGITGIALIIYTTLLYTLNQMGNSGLAVLIYAIVAGGLFMGIREYRTLNGNYLAIGEGVGLGTLLAAVAGILSSAYNILYTTLIDPSVKEQVANQVRAKMEEQGNLTDEQIDQAMDMIQKTQGPGLQFLLGVLGSIVIGAFLSLIISAILRRKKENPFG